jgi:hypothetical protein
MRYSWLWSPRQRGKSDSEGYFLRHFSTGRIPLNRATDGKLISVRNV